MRLQKSIACLTMGAMIGMGNFTSSPILHTYAKEVTNSEDLTQLKAITIDEFQLDQVTAPSTTAYTATVANEINIMTIQLEAIEKSAMITINGRAIEAGKKSSLSLETGENNFSITVTNNQEVATYTITVTRAKNSDSQLANLTLSSGNITFDPEVTDYKTKINDETQSLTIQPEVAAETSTVEINGEKLKAKEKIIEIPTGITIIQIIVTAEDHSSRTYTITVTRAKKEIVEQEEQPSITTQPSKEPEEKQKPDDSSQKEEIETVIDNETTFAKTKLPIVSSNKSVINEQSQQQPALTQLQQNSYTDSETGSFLPDNNTMTTKEGATKANLNALSVSQGSWNKSFISDSYTYHIAVDKDVSEITITAHPEEGDAKVVIKGNETATSAEVKIGNQAKTVISIVITHENDRKTYVLVLDKELE